MKTRTNDFLVISRLFNSAELERLYKTASQLGYKNEYDHEQGCYYILGLKPQSKDAEALFELAEIDV